ncbi:hypothetical protein Ancab_002308 [Ancistrocladus abbreviatus]
MVEENELREKQFMEDNALFIVVRKWVPGLDEMLMLLLSPGMVCSRGAGRFCFHAADMQISWQVGKFEKILCGAADVWTGLVWL